MNVPEAKKQKHCSSRDESAAAAALKNTTPEIHEILKPLLATGFVGFKDLGRLLLLTSKEISASVESGEVWKAICSGYWGVQNASALLQSTKLSPEACFRTLAINEGPKQFTPRQLRYTPKCPKQFTPRQLRYTPKDYLLIVTYRELGNSPYASSKDGKPMFCKTIPGDDIPEFFENGTMELNYERPLWKMECSQLQFHLFWDATIHLLRRPDGRVVQLLGETRGDLIYMDAIRGKAQYSSPVSVRHNRGRQRVGTLTQYGKALANHIFPDNDFGHLDMKLSSPDKYHKVESNFPPHDAQTNTKSAAVGIYGLGIYSGFAGSGMGNEVSTKDAFAPGKEITFAHFLEAIEGWESE